MNAKLWCVSGSRVSSGRGDNRLTAVTDEAEVNAGTALLAEQVHAIKLSFIHIDPSRLFGLEPDFGPPLPLAQIGISGDAIDTESPWSASPKSDLAELENHVYEIAVLRPLRLSV